MTSEGPVLHHVNLKTTRMQEMIDWYARRRRDGALVDRRPARAG